MKTNRLILSFIGTLFIVLNFPITTGIAYPAFIPFPTEAPDTVTMVIDGVIGHHFTVDIFPDLAGFLILMTLCILLAQNTKEKNISYVIPFAFLCFALVTYLLNRALPFYFNGNYRFRLGYLSYFISIIFKNVSLYVFLKNYILLGESTANHSYNNITRILLMTGCLCGAVRDILFFYQLIISSLLYYGAQIILLCYSFYRLYQNRRHLGFATEIKAAKED